MEDEIVDAGAEIIWVLEETPQGEPGTLDSCMEVMDIFGSEDQGWCVGDADTLPEASAFDDSPFSKGRGFDIVVPTSTMVIEFTTNHGTPSGNDNIDGADVLQAVKDVVAGL